MQVVGRDVVDELIENGHDVTGYARSADGAKLVESAGATVLRGRLDDMKSLRAGALSADAVIHLAYIHDIADATIRQRISIIFGGLIHGFVQSFQSVGATTDVKAIETLRQALVGTNRPFIVVFPTMAMKPGHVVTEQDAPDINSPGAAHQQSEYATLAFADRNVRSMVIRIPPTVHGDGDCGLIPRTINIARQKNVSAYISVMVAIDGQLFIW